MFEVLAELFTERNQDTKYIKYDGDYEFWIDTRVQGDLPFQTSNIVLNCYRTSNKDKEVPFVCNWYRIMGGKNFEIKDNAGCQYYKSNPYDIGCKIKVAIKATEGFKGDLAFVTFGPFQLDPSLKPQIEHNIMSSQGSFMFNLLKYDKKDIIDNSDFNNVIEFQDTQLGIRFGESFPEYKDFSVDMKTKGITLKCDYDDPRVLIVYFKKGQQHLISSSILISNQNLSSIPNKRPEIENIENSIGQEVQEDNPEFGEHNMDKSDYDGGFVRFNPLIDIDPEQLFELALKFETRILRDAFITSLRFMRVKNSLPIASIFDSVDVLLRNQWFPVDYEERSHEYILGSFELHSFRAILRRMLRINRNLWLENDSMNEGVDLLESDLESSAKEFKDLISDLKRRKTTRSEVKKYEQVEKSLLNTSYQVEKMRDSSRHDMLMKKDDKRDKVKARAMEAGKVIKMEKELASRKKLNKMLLKEIQKMKVNSKRSSPMKKMNTGGNDRTFNLLGTGNVFQDDRMNRSVLGKGKGEKYLIGLEQDLIDEKNPFEIELEKEMNKAKNKLDFNEIKQINSIKILEEDIPILRKRIQMNQKSYNELLVLSSRIKNGDTLEETQNLYNPNIFSMYGIHNAKNTSESVIMDFLSQTKSSISRLEDNTPLVETQEQKQIKFSFGPSPDNFESNNLGESNLNDVFASNPNGVSPDDADAGDKLEETIEELKKENTTLKNAGESYEHQISDYKGKLSSLLKGNGTLSKNRDERLADLRKKNNKTKKLIQLRRAVRKLEREIEEIEEIEEAVVEGEGDIAKLDSDIIAAKIGDLGGEQGEAGEEGVREEEPNPILDGDCLAVSNERDAEQPESPKFGFKAVKVEGSAAKFDFDDSMMKFAVGEEQQGGVEDLLSDANNPPVDLSPMEFEEVNMNNANEQAEEQEEEQAEEQAEVQAQEVEEEQVNPLQDDEEPLPEVTPKVEEQPIEEPENTPNPESNDADANDNKNPIESSLEDQNDNNNKREEQQPAPIAELE